MNKCGSKYVSKTVIVTFYGRFFFSWLKHHCVFQSVVKLMQGLLQCMMRQVGISLCVKYQHSTGSMRHETWGCPVNTVKNPPQNTSNATEPSSIIFLCVHVVSCDFRWPRWRSSNTPRAPRIACMPNMILPPVPQWLGTTSGATSRWTPPPFTCWCWRRWRPQVAVMQPGLYIRCPLALCELFRQQTEQLVVSEGVTLSHRSSYHFKPGWGSLYPELGLLHRGCLQSGGEYHL